MSGEVDRAKPRCGAVLAASLMSILLVLPSSARADPAGSADGSDGRSGRQETISAPGRLHIVTFNVCDQYLTSHLDADCRTHTPAERAAYVRSQLQLFSYLVDAAAFQEICETTYNMIKDPLGWDGNFMKTLDTGDGRCGSDDDWGIAVVARAPISADLDEPLVDVLGDPDPLRGLACGSTTIYSGFRICSTHTWGQDQVQEVADFTYNWAQARNATIVGGDFNVDNRATCTTANRMRPIYYTERFGQRVRACGPGWNWSHEADNQTSWGDRIYDEYSTEPPLAYAKIDYIFFNHNRFRADDYGGDTVGNNMSDHKLMKGSVSVLD